jgi:hypothetical protein
MTLNPKFLVVRQERFSLDIPYSDRQRVVIVADEQVDAERRARASRASEAAEPAGEGRPAASEAPGDATRESRIAVIGHQFRDGAKGLRDVSRDARREVEERAARWALRRQLGALMIGQGESGDLNLGHGHPLPNMLYIGHPAKRELYYPAAEFHRRVFEHKFVEAVDLLRALGASRIVIQQEQGETREHERGGLLLGLGFKRVRNEHSSAGAEFAAEYPGHGTPVVPDGLCWYPGEQTWYMIARSRIDSGARKTALALTYTTDYGIDTRVVKAARMCGVNLGGKFQRQRNIILRLEAEFPALTS